MSLYSDSNREHYFGTKYIIEENDSLYNIAKRFNTTIEQLRKINHLNSDKLQPGQVIMVDEVYNPNNIYLFDDYKVKEGETIYSIAFKYDMTTDDLKIINNMLTDEIKPGDILYVYNVDKVKDENVYYTVKPGDSLYSIALRFHCSIEDLIELNNLTSNELEVGMELLVLTKEMMEKIRRNSEVYFVLPGDSLYQIAKERGTTVEKIKAVNRLTSNKLSVGQKLLLPKIKPAQSD